MEVFWLLVIAGAIFLVYLGARSRKGRNNKVKPERNTPYQGTIQAAGLTLNYRVRVREETASEEKARELLKQATQMKDLKNFDGAITCLREAYKLMAQSNISYPIETYLRLPLYLQQAGHYTESIVEFEKLLRDSPARIAKEFAHISKQKQNGLSAMDVSTIYDKMRLASQREKQFTYAVYYQILSDANGAVGLKLQKREEELDTFKVREFWANKIEALLKKAEEETLVDDLVNRCMVFSRSCTVAALHKLVKDIPGLLGISRGIAPLKMETATDRTLSGSEVNEVIYNFTQRCFIGEREPEDLDLSQEEPLFKRLAAGPITQVDAHQLPQGQRRVFRELLTQYIMFLEMNKQLPFPPDFLTDSSYDELGTQLLEYICHHKWPFPQMLSSLAKN
jgi:tetratricopeptide (TPR) repeat protein